MCYPSKLQKGGFNEDDLFTLLKDLFHYHMVHQLLDLLESEGFVTYMRYDV